MTNEYLGRHCKRMAIRSCRRLILYSRSRHINTVQNCREISTPMAMRAPFSAAGFTPSPSHLSCTYSIGKIAPNFRIVTSDNQFIYPPPPRRVDEKNLWTKRYIGQKDAGQKFMSNCHKVTRVGRIVTRTICLWTKRQGYFFLIVFSITIIDGGQLFICKLIISTMCQQQRDKKQNFQQYCK